MASLEWSSSYSLVFAGLALCWLLLIYLTGWSQIVYHPWDEGTSWRRVFAGSMLQGLLGAQVLWLAAIGLSVADQFPPLREPQLVRATEVLGTLAIGPYWLATHLVGGDIAQQLALGAVLYAGAFLVINAISVVVERAKEEGAIG